MGTWAMLEVLLLGVFVAYTKLGDLVTIELGPAVYALGILTVVIVWAELALDPQAVWEEIERRGQTHAPMPPVAPLRVPAGRRRLRGVPARLRAGRSMTDDARAAARACTSASPTASIVPWPS